jgi:hypothetical protein
MRALGVVVLDVAPQDRFEVAAAEDEEPVETFGADRADEPLGVGVRFGCAHGRGDDLDAFAAEHLVERQGELAVAIADQEPVGCTNPIVSRGAVLEFARLRAR